MKVKMVSVHPHLVVIGDANLDVIVDLSQVSLREFRKLGVDLINGLDRHKAYVQTEIGGGGVLFAGAAKLAGFDTCLICKFGCSDEGELDFIGQYAVQSLSKVGVKCIYTKQIGERSGKILIIYLANDKRIMISDRGANSKFCREDISSKMRHAVKHANVLHISGYSLLEPNQCHSVIMLTRLAREHGVLTSLDVVPHKLYQFFSYQRFLDLSSAIDVLTIDLTTAMRFIGSSANSLLKLPINHRHPVVSELLGHYACLVLRVNRYTQAIVTAQSVTEEETGYAKAVNKTGHLDKLLAKTLFKIYLERTH